MSRCLAALTLVLGLPAIPSPSAAEEPPQTRLLRFADVHDDRIVFVYAGDLWLVPSSGGTASRLTSHEGLELFPKFSPDGRQIAFSAEYGGNRQVWVMSVDGGAPRALTFYNDVGPMPPRGGWDDQVLDWTPDGASVLFRANRLPWSERMGRPYLVPAAGGMERPLEVPEGGGGSLSPDGTKLAYTPIDREYRTWKRYRGGRAQDVWIYDFTAHTAERITDFEGTDNQALWVGDRIYFTSDRTGRLNLWSYDLTTRATRQVTRHDDYDVLWPSRGGSSIVYECGGRLWLLDTRSERSAPVPIRVGGDFLQTMPRIADVSKLIGGASASPSGARALLDARGDLFTIPAEHGPVRNLTATPGVRELSASWSPDGRTIAYLSDRSGEYEICVRPHDGTGDELRVTHGNDTWWFPPVWSPDSKKLAFGDTRQRLRYVDVESGRIHEVDRGTHGPITSYTWSPDSRWLVYDKTGETRFSSIWIHALETGSTTRLTDGMTNDYGAVFDPEGRQLYFLSDRDFNLTFSGYEFNYLYTKPTRIYAATLRAAGPALLRPKIDEEKPAEKPKEKEKETEKEKDQAPLRVEIDLEGFANRVLAIPSPADVYSGLAATAEALYFVQGTGPEAAVKSFSLEKEKVETVLEGVASFELTRDGKKIFWQKGDKYGFVEAKPGQKAEKALDLAGLQARIDPRAEWRQIFADAWRISRDWFYDPGMHGVDWAAMRALYEPLVDHVAHRADLDYVLGEMGGELNAGHYYVNWGDMPRVERRDGGLLGATIEAHDSGTFRIAEIFPGENWHPDFTSPLTVAGVNAKAGDFILAVDGRPTRGVPNFYALLENTAGKTVVLKLNDKPDEKGAHDERVVPVKSETDLRYLAWVRSRIAKVDELSGGRIGYVHLPNTAVEGNRELSKYFLPQAHKEAMIFDARYNGGGFIPDRMIELVARTQLSYWARRGVEPFGTPGYAHTGPKACLINGYSSSGGDAFPYYFRKLGLGPLIGTRTWGGLIGLSGNPGFLDGGSVSVPTFRFFDTDGQWEVENIGVAPDIEVVDRPDLVAKGQDPSLEKAVEVLLKELEKNPPRKPATPVPPKLGR